MLFELVIVWSQAVIRHKFIANTSNGNEELWLAWIRLKCSAKTHHEVVNGSSVGVILKIPNLLEKLLSWKAPIWIVSEILQQ